MHYQVFSWTSPTCDSVYFNPQTYCQTLTQQSLFERADKLWSPDPPKNTGFAEESHPMMLQQMQIGCPDTTSQEQRCSLGASLGGPFHPVPGSKSLHLSAGRQFGFSSEPWDLVWAGSLSAFYRWRRQAKFSVTCVTWSPGEMVCLLPSYEYLHQVCAHWDKTALLAYWSVKKKPSGPQLMRTLLAMCPASQQLLNVLSAASVPNTYILR